MISRFKANPSGWGGQTSTLCCSSFTALKSCAVLAPWLEVCPPPAAPLLIREHVLETTILIYCNNNFEGNQTDFASKIALPRLKPADALSNQFAAQEKPLMMALNIPTFINLHGYGYRNVYELHELVNVNDPRITFEGSIVEKKTPAPSLPVPVTK